MTTRALWAAAAAVLFASTGGCCCCSFECHKWQAMNWGGNCCGGCGNDCGYWGSDCDTCQSGCGSCGAAHGRASCGCESGGCESCDSCNSCGDCCNSCGGCGGGRRALGWCMSLFKWPYPGTNCNGCGEWYLCDWISSPPCKDQCDCCGNYMGNHDPRPCYQMGPRYGSVPIHQGEADGEVIQGEEVVGKSQPTPARLPRQARRWNTNSQSVARETIVQ